MVFFFLLGGADNEVCDGPGEVNSDRGTEAYNINKTVWSKFNIEVGKIINNLIHPLQDLLDASKIQQITHLAIFFKIK